MAAKYGQPAAWRKAWERANPGKQLPVTAPWAPWTPDPPPETHFDPSLTAQAGQIRRGYGDTLFDAAVGSTRGREDYDTQLGTLSQGIHRREADLTTGRDRTLSDLGTVRREADEDYTRGTQMLARKFQILGGQQSEQQRKFGVARGGAALQAARKRAENQGLEQQDLDTGIGRFRFQNDVAQQRVGEDFKTGWGRIGEDWQTGSQGLRRDFERGEQDTATGVFRATREGGIGPGGEPIGQAYMDIDALKRFQATGAGWTPSEPPPNEFARPGQNPYRVVRQGAMNARVSPAGYLIDRSRRRR